VNPPRGRVAVTSALAALAALLLVALAAAAPTTKFVSKRYGYSIVLPGSSSDWSANFASSTWSSDEIPSRNDLRLDTLADLRRGGLYLIAARRPPAGKTLEKWTDFVVSARPSECALRGPKQLLKSTLDGTPALVVTWSCPEGYWVIVITALHAGRGYFVLLASPTNLSRASDQRRFDAARRSFRFLHG
jgi:hypothetical protein